MIRQAARCAGAELLLVGGVLLAFTSAGKAHAEDTSGYKFIKDHFDQQFMMTFCNIEGFVDNEWLAEVQWAVENTLSYTDPAVADRAWNDSREFFEANVSEIKSWPKPKMKETCESVQQRGLEDLGIGTYEGEEECDGC